MWMETSLQYNIMQLPAAASGIESQWMPQNVLAENTMNVICPKRHEGNAFCFRQCQYRLNAECGKTYNAVPWYIIKETHLVLTGWLFNRCSVWYWDRFWVHFLWQNSEVNFLDVNSASFLEIGKFCFNRKVSWFSAHFGNIVIDGSLGKYGQRWFLAPKWDLDNC